MCLSALARGIQVSAAGFCHCDATHVHRVSCRFHVAAYSCLQLDGRIGAEQRGDHAGVAHLGGHVERRLREATCERVDVGALPEEQLRHARAAAVRGEVERRRAVRAEGIHGRIVGQ